MASTILITKMFPILDKDGFATGKKELLIDYALNEKTLKPVVVPCVHPSELGGRFDVEFGVWYLPD